MTSTGLNVFWRVTGSDALRHEPVSEKYYINTMWLAIWRRINFNYGIFISVGRNFFAGSLPTSRIHSPYAGLGSTIQSLPQR